jgi:signal transduction histidine kinase
MATTAPSQICPLASLLAARLRASRDELVRRWLERITARVSVSPQRVFPSDELLNHVPLLIDGIASYLENPDEELGSNSPVVPKAMELGALRHGQGFDAYEILKEHEILGGVVFTFLANVIEEESPGASARDLVSCWQRVAQAIELIRQATMTHFLRLWADRTHEREERLRRFNRMVSHELKNRVAAIRGASSLLKEDWLQPKERAEFVEMVSENAVGLQQVLEDLEALSRIDVDLRQRRNVLLPQAASEAARQLREPAKARGVKVRIAPDLPRVEVDAAAVEMALVNYLSNAIKYSDPDKSERWAEVSAELRFGEPAEQGGELIVWVRDNGRGVPPEARAKLFDHFFRAHAQTVTGIEGSGLGLSIVRETVEAMGGRAWSEFPPSGETVFAFALPSRRSADAAAAGTKREEVS